MMWAVLQHEGAQLAEWGRFAKAESRRREGERIQPPTTEERGPCLILAAVSFRVDSSLVAISTAFVFCRWFLTLAWRSANYRIAIVIPIRRRRPKPSTAD